MWGVQSLVFFLCALTRFFVVICTVWGRCEYQCLCVRMRLSRILFLCSSSCSGFTYMQGFSHFFSPISHVFMAFKMTKYANNNNNKNDNRHTNCFPSLDKDEADLLKHSPDWHCSHPDTLFRLSRRWFYLYIYFLLEVCSHFEIGARNMLKKGRRGMFTIELHKFLI